MLALAVFALQSIVLPVHPGRDMGRYVQAYVQFWYDDPVLPLVLNTRGPLAALGVGVPLELGGVGGGGLAGAPVRGLDRRLGRRRAEVRARGRPS